MRDNFTFTGFRLNLVFHKKNSMTGTAAIIEGRAVNEPRLKTPYHGHGKEARKIARINMPSIVKAPLHVQLLITSITDEPTIPGDPA